MVNDFNENVILNNTKTLTEITTLLLEDCMNKSIESIHHLQFGENRITYVIIKNPNHFHKSYSGWLYAATYQVGTLGFIQDRSITKLTQICLLSETTIFISLDGSKDALEKLIEANNNYNFENFDSDGYKK